MRTAVGLQRRAFAIGTKTAKQYYYCHRDHNSSPTLTKTMYTIDFCPVTDPVKLQHIVTRHVVSFDRYLDSKPIARHTAAAFAELQSQLESSSTVASAAPASSLTRHIILDSGCGTGRSSLILGRLYPASTVIGVDRSLARLSKNIATRKRKRRTKDDVSADDDDDNNQGDSAPVGRMNGSRLDGGGGGDDPDDGTALVQRAAENVWLVRAELTDFWRLILGHNNCSNSQGWIVDQHYLLYPNPYPKAARLKQRWYAHPSFPIFWQLAATSTIVRSNWKQYLIEFATATQHAVGDTTDIVVTVPPTLLTPHQACKQAWTNFEEKYWLVGEPTYELVISKSAKPMTR